MRDKIRNILREETHPKTEKYINYCVQDYMNGAEVLPIREEFRSAGELRDMGWDDEMVEYAYTQYERFGFREDPENEDVYYHEGNPDYEWDIDEMISDMFYNFIDERVEYGEFIETDNGWEINQNMWDIDIDGETHVIDWYCYEKEYQINSRLRQTIQNNLNKKYAPPIELLSVIRDRIIGEMINLLDNEKKFC
jgi:hypothetical protein